MTDHPQRWLRSRRMGPGVDWGYVAYWTFTACLIAFGLLTLRFYLIHYSAAPDSLFGDARLYFAATQAWVEGGNPWGVRSAEGIAFAGPPTTLLLNLPLLPFGPEAARAFWAAAGLGGWLLAMRRFRLAPWFLVFPPFLEGYLPGGPDAALLGLVLIGGGAITAVAKPYSVPAMVADQRWYALAIGGIVLALTFLVLPWGLFLEELDAVRQAFATQSLNTSAWGNPLLMAGVAAALISLGAKDGLRLATPALWPSAQLHYAVFSVEACARSAFVALVIAVPGWAAPGIIVYAVHARLAPLWTSRVTAWSAQWARSPAHATDGEDAAPIEPPRQGEVEARGPTRRDGRASP